MGAEIDVPIVRTDNHVHERRLVDRIVDAGAGVPAVPVVGVAGGIEQCVGRWLRKLRLDGAARPAALPEDQPVAEGPTSPAADRADAAHAQLADLTEVRGADAGRGSSRGRTLKGGVRVGVVGLDTEDDLLELPLGAAMHAPGSAVTGVGERAQRRRSRICVLPAIMAFEPAEADTGI